VGKIVLVNVTDKVGVLVGNTVRNGVGEDVTVKDEV